MFEYCYSITYVVILVVELVKIWVNLGACQAAHGLGAHLSLITS